MDIHETERNLNNKISRGGGLQCGILASMLSRYRLTAIAFGLSATCTLAQDTGQPALESKPIAPVGQQQSTAEIEQPAAEQSSYADRFLSAVERIEPAIRKLIAEEDEVERQREHHRQIRDLNAQEEMALWAKRMFWATVASVLLTLAGLLLIWRTLEHTKRAAIHAGRAVDEAENATKAAQDAVVETRRIGEAQVRAYVTINPESVGRPVNPPLFPVTIENCGQSPARSLALAADLMILPYPLESDELSVTIGKLTHTYSQIGAGDKITQNIDAEKAFPANEFASASNGKHCRFYLIGRIEYRDVFGEPFYTNFCFSYGKTGRKKRANVQIKSGTMFAETIGETTTAVDIYEWEVSPVHNEAS